MTGSPAEFFLVARASLKKIKMQIPAIRPWRMGSLLRTDTFGMAPFPPVLKPLPENGAKPGFSRRFAMRRA
jgi:hypothetical protein